MTIIRVFPRRTSMTPTDELAFVGEPPLFRPEADEVHVSCCFTWDKPDAERLARAWNGYYPTVKVGGPAYDDPGGEFVSGMYVKPGATITSRGCPRSCPFCFVPKREGALRELPIREGNNVLDNNLLACSEGHVNAVFDMLEGQRDVRFSGGLDARLLQPWHVERMRRLRLKFAFTAADRPQDFAIKRTCKAIGMMREGGLTLDQTRCFVLIGFGGDTLEAAEERCRLILEAGALPFAMLYRDEQNGRWPAEWRHLQRKWCRPAAYRRLTCSSPC